MTVSEKSDHLAQVSDFEILVPRCSVYSISKNPLLVLIDQYLAMFLLKMIPRVSVPGHAENGIRYRDSDFTVACYNVGKTSRI